MSRDSLPDPARLSTFMISTVLSATMVVSLTEFMISAVLSVAMVVSLTEFVISTVLFAIMVGLTKFMISGILSVAMVVRVFMISASFVCCCGGESDRVYDLCSIVCRYGDESCRVMICTILSVAVVVSLKEIMISAYCLPL